MYTKLHFLGDATEWVFADAEADAMLAADADHTAPIAVPAVAPVKAILIISPHALGAVAVLPVPPDTDWMPSYVTAPEACIYVPTAAGASATAPGYRLPADTDLAALQTTVIAAMRDRQRIQVPLAGLPGNVLLINGASLPFVAIVPSA